MLKLNVISKTYKIVRRNVAGAARIDAVTAESPAAARLKAGEIPGWEIAEVAEL